MSHLLLLSLEFFRFCPLVGVEPSDLIVDRLLDRLLVLFANLGAQLLFVV